LKVPITPTFGDGQVLLLRVGQDQLDGHVGREEVADVQLGQPLVVDRGFSRAQAGQRGLELAVIGVGGVQVRGTQAHEPGAGVLDLGLNGRGGNGQSQSGECKCLFHGVYLQAVEVERRNHRPLETQATR
jgi:hypothetical protein